jgi:hypothetical protein
MKLTPKQNKLVRDQLKIAIEAQVECWDAQRQIESIIGIQHGMGKVIEEYAVCWDAESKLTREAAQQFVDSFDLEDEVDN